jgi:hypothetical protein
MDNSATVGLEDIALALALPTPSSFQTQLRQKYVKKTNVKNL